MRGAYRAEASVDALAFRGEPRRPVLAKEVKNRTSLGNEDRSWNWNTESRRAGG